ncbi:MAG: YdbH domain-containing protein, partial [Caulobacteraceae bacterium]|nr:YdbH domain-containing protein [Caulobacter sp.]
RGDLHAPGAALALQGSAGPLRDARVALDGDVSLRGRQLAVRLARCSDVRVGAYVGEDAAPLARDIAARLCPAPAPLLEADPRGWRLAARLPQLSTEAPAAKLAVAQASGAVRLSGAGGAWSGQVRIASARLRDTSTPLRFRPLDARGAVRLDGQEAQADLDISLAQPQRPLGPLHLVQRFDTGVGGLTLEAPALAFAPDALQPAMILPALAPFGTEVKGSGAASLRLGWGKSPADATGEARFRTGGLDFKSSAGPVKGLSTDLRIASLDPLTTAPAQRVHVQALQTLLPLTDIAAVVQLQPAALEIASAGATLGGGRVSLDPMRVPLRPGATITGVAHAHDVQVAPLLAAVNLSRALKLDARLGGVLPFSLGPDGLHFQKGQLAAEGPGRLTLVRQALTGVSADGGPAGAPPSAAQDFAFQALEDLAFTALDARVNSQPGGRLGVLFHIKGRHDPPVGRPARVSLIDLLKGRAFQKSIPLPKGTQVDLTLDTSLNFDDLYKAYLGLGHPAAAAPAPPAAPAAPGSAKVQP